VVYAKRPFAGTDAVLAYLARYTHRVGITNQRLLALDAAAQTVTFSYKDYGEDSQKKVMTLALTEFVRRFRLHILPERFVKIRHHGLLANRNRHVRIAQARTALQSQLPNTKPAKKPELSPSTAPLISPHCRRPGLILVRVTHFVKQCIPLFVDSS